jgi:hypothetical protein
LSRFPPDGTELTRKARAIRRAIAPGLLDEHSRRAAYVLGVVAYPCAAGALAGRTQRRYGCGL